MEQTIVYTICGSNIAISLFVIVFHNNAQVVKMAFSCLCAWICALIAYNL